MDYVLTRSDFNFIKKNRTKLSVSDLAKSLKMPEMGFIQAMLVFCTSHNISLPKMLTQSKSSGGQKTVKILQRHNAEQHIRVSILRLKQAGLGETTRFKSFIDPEKRAVLIVAEDDVKANTIEEALVEIFPQSVRPKRTLSRVG